MEVIFGCTNTQLTGPVVDGTCIRQVFFSPAEMLESISIFFSTYKRSNEGLIVIEIIDFITEKSIFMTQCSASELKDNDWHTFKLNLPLGLRQKYSMKIWTINCRSGQSFTAYYGNKKNWGYLFIGARMIRVAELMCKFNYSDQK